MHHLNVARNIIIGAYETTAFFFNCSYRSKQLATLTRSGCCDFFYIKRKKGF